ncbi:hypothetical protein DPMN_069013 [Dreissena polymorpha]|uniref:Uncharacterized protein n=1 Tax=Dreissena polymorpha TaxID=45954 RepID=A0A9D4BUL7_DREPO|nr:hypothetical protein DPMN_069013 [Dreissena polymorpha]
MSHINPSAVYQCTTVHHIHIYVEAGTNDNSARRMTFVVCCNRQWGCLPYRT